MPYVPLGGEQKSTGYTPLGGGYSTGYTPLGGSSLRPSGRPNIASGQFDLTTSEGLRQLARYQGIDLSSLESEKEPRLSFLQRLGRGLSAFEPVNAFYEAKYDGKQFAVEYVKDIFQEIGSAITGRELQDEGQPKKTFKDVLVREGMKDREGKVDWADVLGFVGDNVFDPTTWFGSYMAKGVKKVGGSAAKLAGAAGDVLAPRTTSAVREIGEAVTRAGKELFDYKGNLVHGEIADATAELGVKKSMMRKEIADKFSSVFEKLPEDLRDQTIDELVSHNTAFGKTRDALLKTRRLESAKAMRSVISEQKKAIKALRASKKLDGGAARLIDSLEKTILSEEGDLAKLLESFKQGDEFIETVTKRGSSKGTIHSAYIADAQAARAFETYEDFAKSDLFKKIQTDHESAKLAAAGFSSPQHFFKSAKGYFKPGGEGVTRTAVDEAAIFASKKKIEKARLQLSEILDIEKPSLEDLVKYRESVVDSLQYQRGVIQEESKTLFKDVAKKVADDFNAVTPDVIFSDPRSAKFYIETLSPELRTLRGLAAETTGMDEALMLNAYFPAMKKDTIRNFSHALRTSKQGYAKAFKGILKKEDMLLDAPEAYARRASEVMGDMMTKKQLNEFVQAYGRKLDAFANAEEAAKAGYSIIKEQGVFGKQVGWMLKDDANWINQVFDPTMSSIDKLAKATGFDAFTGLFKKSVTGLFPAFHARNHVSGLIQNYEVFGLSALRPDNIADGMSLTKKLLQDKISGATEIGGKMVDNAELLKPFADRFAVSSSYISDFGWAPTKKMVEDASKFNPMTHARAVGNAIETNQKMAGYITALRKGYSTEEALKLAERAGFDYSKLSVFEKKVMRRLIPFYSFCMPIDDALAFTRSGWAHADDLTVGEEILTYNMETKKYEWQQLEAINIFDGEDELLTLSNSRHTLRFTEGHRWVTERYGEQSIKTFDEFNTADSIVVTGEFPDTENSSLSPQQAALLGWLITDGYYRWRGEHCEALIYQHPNKWTFNEALKAAGVEEATRFHPNGTAQINVRKDLKEEIQHLLRRDKREDDWVDVVTSLSKEAAQAMYDAMYMADGVTSKNAKQLSMGCAKPGVARTFEALTTLLGKRAVQNDQGFYISKRTKLKVYGMDFRREAYSGRVWCPTTKNGTWVVKHGKLVTITGNSRKNFELQLKTLAETPERLGTLTKMGRSMGTPQGLDGMGENKIPDWMRNRFMANFGESAYGLPQVLSGFGTPIEEQADLFDDGLMGILGRLNPLLRVPLERATGQDFFRQKDLQDVYSAKEYAEAPEFIKNFLRIQESEPKPVYKKGEPTGETRTTYVADPKRLQIARSLFTSRGVTFLHTLFGDSELDTKGRIIKSLTGLKPYELDEDSIEYFEELENMRDLRDLLKAMGITANFESAYLREDVRQ